MHEVIQKMIDSAKESGELTESQKDYILLKAKSLGQNVEDVEFLLAGIPKKERLAQSVHNYSTSKKCPNCGAIIPGFSFLCPECGFVFQNESDSSAENRQAFKFLLDSLQKTRRSKDKAAIINAFVMPNTKEALIQLLIMAYSNYETGEGVEDEIVRRAWLSKALHAYQLLSAQAGNDKDVAAQLKKYSVLGDRNVVAKLSGTNRKKIIRVVLITLFLLIVGFVLYLSGNDYRQYKQAVTGFLAIPIQDCSPETESKLISMIKRDDVKDISIFNYEDSVIRYDYSKDGLSKYYLLPDAIDYYSKVVYFDINGTLLGKNELDNENIYYSHLLDLKTPSVWLVSEEAESSCSLLNVFWNHAVTSLFSGCRIESVEYEAFGAIKSILYSNGECVHFEYDNNNHLTMASSGWKDDNYSRGYFMSKMWEYQWSGDKLHCVKELLWNAETQSFDTISSSVFFYDYGGNLTNWKSLTFDVEYHYLGDYVFVSYSHNELIFFRGPDNKPRFGIWIIRPEGIDTHPWQFKTK